MPENYDLFKTSGVKGSSSLDALFVVEAEIDCDAQNLTQNDTLELFDLPAGTAVVGVLLKGKGEDEGTARNIEIGTSSDSDAVLTAEDIRAENINIYKPGAGVYFDEETTIKLKATSDATYDSLAGRIALVCVTI